jgi:hypothetical protein
MSDVIRIDKDRALELLRQVVEGREDFVYPSLVTVDCVYAHRGKPSCIVGHALVLAGATVKRLAELDGLDDGGIRNVEVEWLALTDEAAQAFGEAQDVQDTGFTWGQALNAAVAAVPS